MIMKDNKFKVIPFTALVDGEKFLVHDKAYFENDLLSRLQMEEEINAKNEGREPIEVVLPEIKYKDNVLSAEQNVRLTHSNTFSTLTLKDASEYIMEGFEPNNIEFQLDKESKRINGIQELNDYNMVAMTEMFEENLKLKAENESAMLAVTELYEMLMGASE